MVGRLCSPSFFLYILRLVSSVTSPPYGCLLELTVQLAVLMVGKQAINNVQELVLPMIMNFIDSYTLRQQLKRARRRAKKKSVVTPPKPLVYPWQDDVT